MPSSSTTSSSSSGTSSSGSTGTSDSGSSGSLTSSDSSDAGGFPSVEVVALENKGGKKKELRLDVDAVKSEREARQQEQQKKKKEEKGKEEVESPAGGASSDSGSEILLESDESSGVLYIDESDSEFAITPTHGGATPKSGKVTVVEPSGLVELAMGEIENVASTLAVSDGLAAALLSHARWSRERVLSAWFEDRNKMLETVGGVDAPPGTGPAVSTVEPVEENLCGVCFVPPPEGESLIGLECCHGFCKDCWVGFLSVEVRGSACVYATCMGDACRHRVSRPFVVSLLPDDLVERYDRFFAAAFVAAKASAKACPNPRGGCDAAAFYAGFGTVNVDCVCGFGWCFHCSEEVHLPASCEDVKNWAAKAVDEAGNTEWILANTKQCPKCKVAVEKNAGCMHMTCKAHGCTYEWCWLCLGPWKEHGSSTGGYYACSRYAKSEAAVKDKQANIIKEAHDRYIHYYERYHNHDVSRGFARQISQTASSSAEEYALETGWNGQFLVDAADLVIQARQVLKWSYAFGYYMPESSPLRPVFEQQQGDLEAKTEHLSELIEQPIALVTSNSTHIKNFSNVLSNYLGNLVRAWQEYVK